MMKQVVSFFQSCVTELKQSCVTELKLTHTKHLAIQLDVKYILTVKTEEHILFLCLLDLQSVADPGFPRGSANPSNALLSELSRHVLLEMPFVHAPLQS